MKGGGVFPLLFLGSALKDLTLSPLLLIFGRYRYGWVAEWLKAHAWKVCLVETLTEVRILSHPPFFASNLRLFPKELRLIPVLLSHVCPYTLISQNRNQPRSLGKILDYPSKNQDIAFRVFPSFGPPYIFASP